MVSMCSHPNIITFYDAYENTEYIFIIMEYMKGKDLFDYLETRDFKISEQRAK